MLAFAFACGNNNGLERPGLDLTNRVTRVNVKPLYLYWSVKITSVGSSGEITKGNFIVEAEIYQVLRFILLFAIGH